MKQRLKLRQSQDDGGIASKSLHEKRFKALGKSSIERKAVASGKRQVGVSGSMMTGDQVFEMNEVRRIVDDGERCRQAGKAPVVFFNRLESRFLDSTLAASVRMSRARPFRRAGT